MWRQNHVGRRLGIILVSLMLLMIAISLFACQTKEREPDTKDGAPMVFVPAGEFLMGSDILNEQPEHTVYLDDFWIDKYEVTNGNYQKCVEEGGCSDRLREGSNIHRPYYGDPAFDNFPVNQVTWAEANQYCQWAGKRLPTEAEWEKAARGTDGRIFPWGNEWDASVVHSNQSNFQDTVEVGSFPEGASPYGAMDMAGNLWEWVNDWYSETYYAESPDPNPTGPAEGNIKVIRGGGYGGFDAGMRVSVRRGDLLPSESLMFVGFRCVY